MITATLRSLRKVSAPVPAVRFAVASFSEATNGATKDEEKASEKQTATEDAVKSKEDPIAPLQTEIKSLKDQLLRSYAE
eukprot:gene50437-61708_t